MVRKDFKLELTYRCPSCGRRLVLLEDSTYVWIGCEYCCTYVRVEKRHITERVAGCKVFPWREIIQNLYETLCQVCQR